MFMAVKIGHAHSDENGRASGGVIGDQTSREVVVQDWYLRSGGWTIVFRPKDNKVAEKIAKAMEQACENNNIGYDQSQRTTLYTKAKELKWDLSKIKDACECDCSSLVAVCVNAAGISVNKNMYTGSQKILLEATGKFSVLTDKKYLTKSKYLKRGDILLGPGHTAIVLSNDASVNNIEKTAIDSAKSFKNSFAGTYKVAASKLNIRSGAGTLKKIMVVIPKHTEVRCFGYYTKTLGTNWLYVQFTYKGLKYTGFASAKYLAKINKIV
jgi:hypothetical protein